MAFTPYLQALTSPSGIYLTHFIKTNINKTLLPQTTIYPNSHSISNYYFYF